MIGSQEWCQLYNNLPVGFASVTLWCQFLNLPVGVVKVLEALYPRYMQRL